MTQLRATKFLMTISGTYNDQFYRPYTMQASLDNVNRLNEVTRGFSCVTVSNLASVAGNILRPSAEVERSIEIDAGWGEERAQFMLEVDIIGAGGLLQARQILTGYSNYVGMTQQGNVDPRMLLYINNVVTLSPFNYDGLAGTYQGWRPVNTSQVLRGNCRNSRYGLERHHEDYTMRPEDIVAASGLEEMLRQYGDEDYNDVHDYRQTFVEGVRQSSRGNNLASSYMSRVLKSHVDAYNSPSLQDADHETVLSDMVGRLRESSMSGDYIFNPLMRETAFQDTGAITYSELCSVIQNADAQLQIIWNKGVVATHRVIQRGATEHWEGSGLETIVANTLAVAVPSLMMDNLINNIAFSATNLTRDNTFEVIPEENSVEMFTQGVNSAPYIGEFINRLCMEVLYTLTNNNMIGIEVYVEGSVTHDTFIQISIDGGPVVDYGTPTFADHLFTPIITSSRDNVNGMGANFSALIDTVGNMGR